MRKARNYFFIGVALLGFLFSFAGSCPTSALIPGFDAFIEFTVEGSPKLFEKGFSSFSVGTAFGNVVDGSGDISHMCLLNSTARPREPIRSPIFS